MELYDLFRQLAYSFFKVVTSLYPILINLLLVCQ
jgi:hypothetical protein